MKGVSVGAILSNYQRVRVEHVYVLPPWFLLHTDSSSDTPLRSCRRLGLTSLAYLWQRDQAELLSEMIDAGLTAVLIKVAGIGLTTKHLGKTLQEMQPTLTKLVCRWPLYEEQRHPNRPISLCMQIEHPLRIPYVWGRR